MNTSLGKNFSLLMAANLLAPVFSMVLVLAISRIQGVEPLGKYSLVMTVFVLGQSCAAFGLPIIITREVARVREEAGRYFFNACILTTALLLPVVCAALPALHATMSDRSLAWAIWLVLLALVPSVVTIYAEAVLLAFERAQDFVAVGLAENIMRATLGTALVFAGSGIVAIALTIVVLRLVACVALVVVLRRHGIRLAPIIDTGLCRQLLHQVPVVGSIPIVNAIYARMDIFLLTWLGTWHDVGVYSAAVRLVDVARTIPPAYGRALYPILSRLRSSSSQEFTDAARRALHAVLLMIVPVSLLLSGLAQPLIVVLYGPELESATSSLRVLAWTLIPVTVATTLAQVLFAAGMQTIDLRVNVIATAIGIALNLTFIPLRGALGAAMAMLLTAIAYAALQYVWVRQHVTNPTALGHVSKLVLVACASLALMLAVRQASPLLIGGAGVLSYVVGITLAGVVTFQDLQRLLLQLGSATGLRPAR